MGSDTLRRIVALMPSDANPDDRPDVDPYHDLGLLRLTTAGSVDDGKSTLIGRLLYDTKSIFEDQLEALERASVQRGERSVNLALLTDGLRAEREQNITIDVAYRYFATPRRKFIIADTPGHLQYTRNMVTGASLADLAIVLVDARKGVQTQSKRHGFIANLLGIRHLVVAVNKMDLVDFDEAAFRRIRSEYVRFAQRIGAPRPLFIPMSALHGDNVVDRSEKMPWYAGPALLDHLETLEIQRPAGAEGFRLPVQYVVRPHQDFRGFAGRVASGRIRPGDEVVALPGGQAARVAAIETADGPLEQAAGGDSVVLTLDHELDISRGDLIAARSALPTSARRLDAVLCWMSDQPLRPDLSYLMMHATRQLPAQVLEVQHRTDIDTLEENEANTLRLNDIGRVTILASEPVFFDPFGENSTTGSFILIHPHTHGTVAAGMIRGALPEPAPPSRSRDVVWEPWNIPREERERRNGHRAAVVWFTGLSGAGKTTIARELERRLFAGGVQTMLLDGDQLRHGLCGDLGFSQEDRSENLRRAGEATRLFYEGGTVVLGAFVSPFRSDRERLRTLFPEGAFFEIHVDADLATCSSRDPKGLYAKALAGAIDHFTGVTSPYEAPDAPELRIDTRVEAAGHAVERIIESLHSAGIITKLADRWTEGEG
jgi:bifunctional enzyme CysN/CysC